MMCYIANGCNWNGAILAIMNLMFWFEHVERSSGAVRTACSKQIDRRQGAGRPKLTWKKLTEINCHKWKLMTVDPQERCT